MCPEIASADRVDSVRENKAIPNEQDAEPLENKGEPLGVAIGELVPVKGGPSDRANPAAPATAAERPTSAEPPEPDPVEVALAKAIARASEAGQWAIVESLARQLESRRDGLTSGDSSHRSLVGGRQGK